MPARWRVGTVTYVPVSPSLSLGLSLSPSLGLPPSLVFHCLSLPLSVPLPLAFSLYFYSFLSISPVYLLNISDQFKDAMAKIEKKQ